MKNTFASRQASPNTTMIKNMATKGRLVFFVLVGVTGLLLRGRYSGPWREVVHSYGGNLSVSFAVYFVLAVPFLKHGRSRLIAAGTALAAVELFEVLDGFGVDAERLRSD